MKRQLQPLTPAALYARVSSDRQDVDLSVAAQLRALRDYAKNNGYTVKGGDRVGHWGGGIVYHRHERLTSVDQTEGRQWRSRNGQRCQRVMRCPGLRELGARRSRGCA